MLLISQYLTLRNHSWRIQGRGKLTLTDDGTADILKATINANMWC